MQHLGGESAVAHGVSRSLQATLTHSLGRRNQSSRTCHAYGTESCSRQAWMVALIRPAASAQDQCALAELASWKRTTFPVRATRPPGAVWEGHKHQPHRAHGSSRATLRRARPTQEASMWSRISCSRPRSPPVPTFHRFALAAHSARRQDSSRRATAGCCRRPAQNGPGMVRAC